MYLVSRLHLKEENYLVCRNTEETSRIKKDDVDFFRYASIDHWLYPKTKQIP